MRMVSRWLPARTSTTASCRGRWWMRFRRSGPGTVRAAVGPSGCAPTRATSRPLTDTGRVAGASLRASLAAGSTIPPVWAAIDGRSNAASTGSLDTDDRPSATNATDTSSRPFSASPPRSSARETHHMRQPLIRARVGEHSMWQGRPRRFRSFHMDMPLCDRYSPSMTARKRSGQPVTTGGFVGRAV